MSFALSSRMARREVRRRPFRTLLVAMLVVVPSIFFVITQTVSRTMHRSSAETFRSNFGAADVVLYVEPATASPNGQASQELRVREEVKKVLGSQAKVTRMASLWVPMRIADVSVPRERRSKSVVVLKYQPDDEILGSTLEMLRGRSATSDREVVVTERLASSWKIDVGDTLSLSLPKVEYSVVGIARKRSDWKSNAILVNSPRGLTVGADDVRYLVQVPGDLTWSRFSIEHPQLAAQMLQTYEGQQYGGSESETGVGIWQFTEFVDGGPGRFVGEESRTPWLAVLLILEFAVLSVVIAAAFATSARRQLITIGQLGANGAQLSVVRMALAFQGLWNGLVGLAVTSALYISLLIFGHGATERLVGRDLPAWRLPTGSFILLFVVALVSATIAAWLPARTASRTSVLQALAGRSNSRELPRRLLPIGLGLFACGTGLEFMTAVGVTGDTYPQNTTTYLFSGALGGLLILAGACCLGPVIVSFFGPIGARVGGVLRLTARSLSRGRARSAAVVVGVTAFAALGLSASTALVTAHNSRASWEPAPNVVAGWGTRCPRLSTANSTDIDPTGPSVVCTLAELSDAVSESMNDTLSGSARAPIRWATFTPSNPLGNGNYSSRLEVHDPGGVVIADELVLESIGLSSRDMKTFESAGIAWVANPADFTPSVIGNMGMGAYFDAATRTLRVSLMTTNGAIKVNAHVPVDRPRYAPASTSLFITEEKARALGLEIEEFGEIFVQSSPLKEWQRVELQFLSNYQATYLIDASMAQGMDFTSIVIPWNSSGIGESAVEALIAGVVLLATLFIVAIGLSLMAAEGKEERDVLVAVGAAPRSLASLAALRALLLTACAVLLAVPVGLIPVSLVLNAGRATESGGVEIPWTTVALLVCIPFVSYAVTRITTAVAQRLKPVTMSSFAFD